MDQGLPFLSRYQMEEMSWPVRRVWHPAPNGLAGLAKN